MLSKWLPWKFLVRHALHRHGFIDPFTVLARLRRFAQPSDVQEPIELIRAGIVFHARGVLNARAIQHNLDWVWPYWVERQFRPEDPSFIPRAFSFSHINLSHRNWTAVGQPDWPAYPIVDPRGLVTPLFDGWSLDAWVVGDAQSLLPSKLAEAEQSLQVDDQLAVHTRAERRGQVLQSDVGVVVLQDQPVLQVQLKAEASAGQWLAVAVRPYNPEGVQFVEAIDYWADERCLEIEKKHRLTFSEAPDRVVFANYQEGDVLQHLTEDNTPRTSIRCGVGMATAAAMFRLDHDGKRSLDWRLPLPIESVEPSGARRLSKVSRTWPQTVEGTARLTVPDSHYQYLYESAVRTLLLLSADEIVPGPYTYRRFWFRDASLMMNALIVLGLGERCVQALQRFPERQDRHGCFRSQEGEWDSNGQVLWIYGRYRRCFHQQLPAQWKDAIYKGAAWIGRKRRETGSQGAHAGLLPPGFSAEHFGPIDWYYWDDLWGVAGLDAAADLAAARGDAEQAQRFRAERNDFMAAILRSLDAAAAGQARGAWPAASYRRLDSGAIGLLAADYPLQLVQAGHEPLLRTIDYFRQHCFHRGAFFQDMIHSGINAYLTLTIAQVLLRAGDASYRELIDAVAGLASPTGQWPEAIHPHTTGGCMGDGQHGWAAAEWILMIRNLFVREEGDALLLGSGLFPRWLEQQGEVAFGPTPTPWGPIHVRFTACSNGLLLTADAAWHGDAPELRVQVPGYRAGIVREPVRQLLIERNSA